MRTVVCPIVRNFNPGIVLISAGFDATQGHPPTIGGYNVSPACFASMTSSMLQFAEGKVVLALEGGYIAALRHLLAGGRTGRLRAADIMDASSPYVSPDAPVAQLLPMMADGEVDAVPVLDEERLVGIVTGTDLIAALAHKSLSDQSAV